MRVLVTGGAGFIGSNLVDRLVRDGHEVAVVDDLSSGCLDNLAGALASGRVRHYQIDLTAPDLPATLAAVRPQVVHHLAAQIDVRRSVADPVEDARVNVLGSLRLARAALDVGCRRLVFAASGGSAYGEPDPDDIPVTEDHPELTSNPYGIAKRSVEDYLDGFRALYGLEPVSLRLANVYGPRQDPHGEAGVVAVFCDRLLAGRPVTVYGDGTQTRDYVYVGDVVEAFAAAADSADAVGTRVNIGTGVETSVMELYAMLRGVTGFGPDPEFAPARAGELARIALDPRLAARLLGWRPRTTLTEGLARTWAWAVQKAHAQAGERGSLR
jgi:UDP-glucose 4-epimerase